jgi:MFS family permease
MLAALAALVSVCALLMAALQPSMPTFVVLVVLALFGASAIGWNGVYLAEVAREAPAGQASIATGGTLAITFLGVVLGPPAFGALSGASGSYRIGFVAVAVALVVCLAALLRPLRKGAASLRSLP